MNFFRRAWVEDKLWRQSLELRHVNGCQTENNENIYENVTMKRKRSTGRLQEVGIGRTKNKDRRNR